MYEVLNIRSLKQATPNLSVINLWGVSFVDDSHVEAFSSNCILLAALSLNFCTRVKVWELGTIKRFKRVHLIFYFLQYVLL